MDRFKFRVWENNTRNCYLKDEKTAIIGDGGLIYGNTITNTIPLAYGADNPNIIVEQSTGLRDKNGNLIYEGDLLKAKNSNIIYVVCWAHHGFVMKIHTDSASSYPLDGTDLFEIIGNVHQTKE